VDIKPQEEEVKFEPVSVKIHKPTPVAVVPMPQSPFPKTLARDFTAPFLSITVTDPIRINEFEDDKGTRIEYLVTVII
jgi:hypothetical protein